MYTKTSSIAYQYYGAVINSIESLFDCSIRRIEPFKIMNNFNILYSYPDEIYISVKKGIALIYVNKQPSSIGIKNFVIHRMTSVHRGIYFNIIPLSDDTEIELFSSSDSEFNITSLSETVSHASIAESFHLDKIYAYYYQLRPTDYFFSGEEHSHWELTYVDSGKLITNVDNVAYELNKQDLMLYTPDQFHDQRTFKESPCSYVTIMFDMDLVDIDLFQNRVFHLSDTTYQLFNNLMKVTANERTGFVNDQLLCFLKMLLIELVSPLKHTASFTEVPIQERSQNEKLNAIFHYIHDNLFNAVNVMDLCYKFNISRSTLQLLFKENVGMSPKEYINKYKLNKSRYMIKEGKYTINEIALMLGYSSINHFSKTFKEHYGISPSDYSKQIF